MQVTVLIGDPIEFTDLRNMEETQYVSRGKLYDAVSARIGDHLRKLKTCVDRLAIEQSLQSQNYPWGCSDRAARILQQVDWESVGMESYIGTDCESSRQRQSLHAEGKLEDNSANHYFKVGIPYEGGMISRSRGYMDPTELMGFAARGLFTSRSMKGDMKYIQGEGPFKTWNDFWKQMHHTHGFPANLILA